MNNTFLVLNDQLNSYSIFSYHCYANSKHCSLLYLEMYYLEIHVFGWASLRIVHDIFPLLDVDCGTFPTVGSQMYFTPGPGSTYQYTGMMNCNVGHELPDGSTNRTIKCMASAQWEYVEFRNQSWTCLRKWLRCSIRKYLSYCGVYHLEYM